MTPRAFGLISHTKLVTAGDLHHLALPLERSLGRCAAAWGRAAPAVVVHKSEDKLPRWVHPLLALDSSVDPQVLADHYWDPLRSGPVGRIFAESAQSFNGGPRALSVLFGHEACEALIDPQINLWVPWPGPDSRPNVDLALENADPLQTAYTEYFDGAPWSMANFVYPEYFERDYSRDDVLMRLFESGGKLDESGELRRAGQIGPDGYIILRDRTTGQVWYEFATEAGRARLLEHDKSPLSRTAKRGVTFAAAQ